MVAACKSSAVLRVTFTRREHHWWRSEAPFWTLISRKSREKVWDFYHQILLGSRCLMFFLMYGYFWKSHVSFCTCNRRLLAHTCRNMKKIIPVDKEHWRFKWFWDWLPFSSLIPFCGPEHTRNLKLPTRKWSTKNPSKFYDRSRRPLFSVGSEIGHGQTWLCPMEYTPSYISYGHFYGVAKW